MVIVAGYSVVYINKCKFNLFYWRLDCAPTEIALIENATTGTNAVLKSMKFNSADTIYYLDCTYGKLLLQYYK